MPSNRVRINYRLRVKPRPMPSVPRKISLSFIPWKYLIVGIIFLWLSFVYMRQWYGINLLNVRPPGISMPEISIPFVNQNSSFKEVPGTPVVNDNSPANGSYGLTSGLRLEVVDDKFRPVSGLRVMVDQEIKLGEGYGSFLGEMKEFYTDSNGAVTTALEPDDYAIRLIANSSKAYEFVSFTLRTGQVVLVKATLKSNSFTYSVSANGK